MGAPVQLGAPFEGLRGGVGWVDWGYCVLALGYQAISISTFSSGVVPHEPASFDDAHCFIRRYDVGSYDVTHVTVMLQRCHDIEQFEPCIPYAILSQLEGMVMENS